MSSEWILKSDATTASKQPTLKETSRTVTSEKPVTPNSYSKEKMLHGLIAKLSEETKNAILLLSKVNYTAKYPGILR